MNSRLRNACLTVASLAIALPALARAEPPPSAEREIARLEDVYSQSFVTGDASVAERLVAEDFVGLEANGKSSTKADILADVKSEPHPKTLEIPALAVRVYGDTALALGTEVDTMPAGAPSIHRRWLDTWRRTPEGWKLIASAEMITPH